MMHGQVHQLFDWPICAMSHETNFFQITNNFLWQYHLVLASALCGAEVLLTSFSAVVVVKRGHTCIELITETSSI